jgi:hypothetical protein
MKKTVLVDREKLQSAIQQAEANGPLGGMTQLWKKVSDIYNVVVPDAPISSTVVYLRATDWKLEYKTQPGKKGRSGPMTEEQKAAMAAARSSMVRRSRGEKMACLSGASKHFETLRKITPKSFQGLVDKVEKGSLTAAIKLMCIQCMGFEKKNVWDCRGLTCPMYLHRPYQKAEDAEAAEAEDTEVAEAVEDIGKED